MSPISADRLIIADDMAHIYNSDLDAFDLYHRYQHQKDSSPSAGTGLPALGHAVAGSIGTATSNLAIYPLSLIITRLQVQRTLGTSGNSPEDNYKGVIDAAQKIYKNEGGIAAFYSGVVQDTGKSIVDSFLFFLFYESMRKNRLQKHGKSATTLPVLDELAVGALAGAFSKFFTAPISNIVTRKQTAAMRAARSSSPASEPTVTELVQQIRDEKGVLGFWSGYSAQLVLTLNPSITFFLYETFKRLLLPRSKRDDPGARLTFLMAASSKAIASAITYPFSLAKARAQASSKAPVDPNAAKDVKREAESAANEKDEAKAKAAGRKATAAAKRSTVFSAILKIYREEGLSALYEGVWGEVAKGFFSHGTTMLVKEAIHKFVIQLYMMILKALNKSPIPSPAEVTEKASQAAEQANKLASDGYAKVGDAASGAYSKAGEVAEQAGQAVTGAYNNAVSAAGSLAQNLSGTTQDVAGRAQVVGENVLETTKTGGNATSTKAGELLGQVQSTVGQNLENTRKVIKGGDSDSK